MEASAAASVSEATDESENTAVSSIGGAKVLDFDAMGAKILQSGSGFRNHDVLYRHTGNGATVHCGNIVLARDKSALAAHKISHIVNCQDNNSENFFDSDPDMHYLRFPVAHWRRVINKSTGAEKARAQCLAYTAPLFQFVDKALGDGKNVLIHCRAGAHRAGTTSIAYLMHAAKLDMAAAMALAKENRPIIDPFDTLLQFLELLNTALGRRAVNRSEDVHAKEQYLKMLRAGVPPGAVRHKMKKHGHLCFESLIDDFA